MTLKSVDAESLEHIVCDAVTVAIKSPVLIEQVRILKTDCNSCIYLFSKLYLAGKSLRNRSILT